MTSVPSDLVTEASSTESVRLLENRVKRAGKLKTFKRLLETASVISNMYVCALRSLMKPKLSDSFRCQGDISRSDCDFAETRNQPGHSFLCDELAGQLVQR